MALPLPFDTQGFPVVNVLNIANWALLPDANNTPPVALVAGVTYTGTWTRWEGCNKLDLVGSIDQAGTLYIDQSRNGGATTATTEQWAGAIGETFAFPTARGVGCNAYRLRFLAGGVNLAALVLAPSLTVGEVDSQRPVLVSHSAIAFTAVRPVGSRLVTVLPTVAGAGATYTIRDNAATVRATIYTSYAPPATLVTTDADVVYGAAGDAVWYP
jgi:hypothetical protein